MIDFGMAPTDDGLTPKIGRMGNLDAKIFILGQGNVMGKLCIQEFFNCVGNLSLDDAPICRCSSIPNPESERLGLYLLLGQK